MDDWTNIETYLDLPTLLDVEYCRTLWGGCALTHQSAYDWLEFIDNCGVSEPGDYYTHTTYPEIKGTNDA